MSKHKVVNNSLRRFDELQNSAKQHAKTLNAFIKILKYLFHQTNAPNFCRESFFIRYGSNRERTVVSEEADFDLIMVLPPPFTLDKLYPAKFEEGVFMLNAKRNLITDSSTEIYFTNGEPRKLRSLNLRTDIFNYIIDCLKMLRGIWDGWNITHKMLLTNLKIKFDNKRGRTLAIDVIPQIGAKLGYDVIPGCIHVSSFHSALQSYIKKYNFSAFYVLGFPPHVRNDKMKHLLLQINFGLLELSAIESSENARNTIRMCKAISVKTRMKCCGLSSYHIKRMALLCLDDIVDSDPYDGIRFLLSCISSSLKKGYLPDYFFPNQNLFNKDEKKAFEIVDKIESILSSTYSGRNCSLLNC